MKHDTQSHWISKDVTHLPDFIIGGAMKSGTTTLHAILNNHPDISIAHDELGFFDVDSILQHPDFNFFDKANTLWHSPDLETAPDLFWNWYRDQFRALNHTGLLGEDSTTYLASKRAALRISQQPKPIKMIFVLRHPTARTISNYLHLLKSGRAIYNLEDTLRYNPHSIINRSLYLEQLQYYYDVLPFQQIKVVLFEDLIHDRNTCLKSICDFLGVDFDKYQATDLEVHSNKTVVPKNMWLQLLRNRWMQKSRDYRYSHFLPIQPPFNKPLPLGYRLIDKLHKQINPKRSDYKFIPNASTVALLDKYFKIELEGIDELTQQNIYSKWFSN